MDVRIIDYVTVIVVVDEWMLIDRVVNRQRGNDDQQTDNDVSLFRGSEQPRGLWRRSNRLSAGRRQQVDLTTEGAGHTEAWKPRHLVGHFRTMCELSG
jgi:hypothetical protein